MRDVLRVDQNSGALDGPGNEIDAWTQEASAAFLEFAPDAVIVIESSGRIILVNAQTEDMFGYRRHELVGEPVEVLLPERFRPGHGDHRARYAVDPQTRAMGAGLTLFGRRADCSEFPIDISLSPLETSRGLLFAAAVRDITDRRSAEAKFGSFLESAPDAIVVIETDGRISLVNLQTERLFGYVREDLVGKPVEMLLPLRFRHSHIGHRAGYIHEPRVRAMGAGLDLYGLRQDGSEFPIDISLAPVDTAEGRLIAATVRDVTERKQLEAARDQFIHHAAHELRTPLATLAALSETLALRIDEMSKENVTEALAALSRQGKRASTLVANLLDLSQLERDQDDVRLSSVDLAQAMSRVMEGAPAPSGTTVSIEIDRGFTVTADPVQLERVLTNLLTNAYRYGGDHVRVLAKRNAEDVVIDFADNGEGVPWNLVDTIFDPFVRGRTAGEVGGSGVGLALCRRIVEAFGGSIWYDATGPGAHFKFRLREYQ
jgi:PAS domain S-box-containing protein